MVERYESIFLKFMSFKDSTTYRRGAVFTTAELLSVTPRDVWRWLSLRAYGDPDPTPDMKPSTAWDPITGQGYPTRAELVNKLIKKVEKSEVRREGVESKAWRAIEFKEFVGVLSLVRTGKPASSKYMVASVLTLQWHLIARIDDMMKLRFADFTPNLQHPSTIICRMRWSKNILEERDAPEQIFVGSMDPRLCPLLSLAVYLESSPRDFYTEFLYGNPAVGDRVVRRILQTAFADTSFEKLKSGNMGTHSLRKGSATYGTRSGLSKDYVNRRGRWRTKKAMVDTYIDNTQPYPDACAAAVLAGPEGPCLYRPNQNLQFMTRSFLANAIAPVTERVLGGAIAEVLGAALLWATTTQDDSCGLELIPAALKARVQEAFSRVGGSVAVAPVVRESFHVVGDGAELQLVGIRETEAGEVTTGMANNPSSGSGTESQRRQFAAVHTQLFAMRRHLDDLMAEVLRSRAQALVQQQSIATILKRLLMRPVLPQSREQPSEQASDPAERVTRAAPAQLSKRPKDLYELWFEYEFGCAGRKPTSSFTSKERGANRFMYSRRKVFWDVVANLVRAGYTSDTAIDKVYTVYGRQLCVSSIIDRLRQDRVHGGHPALRV